MKELTIGKNDANQRLDRFLDKAVPLMIASWKPARIVYVSCFAPTMHRDVRRLADLGYRPESLKMFDFYPQTPHVETVVLMLKV